MKKYVPVLLLALCAALLGGTFFVLLSNRFAQGDVYPASSSLRSDPLGTMIFYESLAALPGLQVQRDHSPLNRLPDGNGTTYLHLGADMDNWQAFPTDTYRMIEGFLQQGGRLVITLRPTFRDPAEKSGDTKAQPSPSPDPKAKDEKDGNAKKKKKKKPEAEEEDDEDTVSLDRKWGIILEVTDPEGDGRSIARCQGLPGLPAEMAWHGQTILKKTGPDWTVIYRTPKGAVMAERRGGPGTIVFATDSYFVSNEALVRDRNPALLAWLIGGNHRIVFDETHHGVVESPGVASLARKYHLTGAAVALVILALLFVWKNSSSLATPHRSSARPRDLVPGRNAAAGFTGLLRRNIPISRLLDVCATEWRRTSARPGSLDPRQRDAVEEVFREEAQRADRDKDPVAAYERIRRILHRRAAPSKNA